MDSSTKFKIIANPAARKGAATTLIPKMEEKLNALGVQYDLVRTERPWHAADLASQAAEQGYDAVVAAGGDGTCNEVINGLMRARQNGSVKPSLGVICIGQGNDFAFGAGIPTGWEAGCESLANGQRAKIDVGHLRSDCLPDGRYFGNGIGIGFDAVVNVQATKTRLTGFAGYTVAALRTILLHFTSPMMRIVCDETTITQPSIMVSVMNGRRMGGGFLMAPDSSNGDGQLDLCIAHKVSRLTILMLIPSFMRGSQGSHQAIRFARSSRVTVTALEGSLPMHIDGETVCTDGHQVIIETLPGSLEIIR
jgi:YegS/Rv2252/BmrU family lipid kinase